MANPAIRSAVEAMEASFNGRGRILLRASGTEPLIRVMAEGEDSERVNSVVQELASVVEKAVG